MKVLLIAAEAMPYCKVGGLADVVGALFKELRNRGIRACLGLPFYRRFINPADAWTVCEELEIQMGPRRFRFKVLSEGDVYLFDCPELFDRDGIYGERGTAYEDNPIRYAFFSRAVLEFLKSKKIKMDILHLHDWQTALVPFYLRTVYKEEGLRDMATVFTIHNLGYQGITDRRYLSSLGIPEGYFSPDRLEFYGNINILKAGILYSDILTTVSPTYAKEITTKEFGYGLEGVLTERKEDLYGILNGLDYEEFSPENDPYIKRHYGPENIKGKVLCRRQLIKETALNAKGVPLVAYIGRLVQQKGLDILLPALKKAIQWGVPFCILGQGEHLIEDRLRSMAVTYRDKLFVKTAFDEAFSRRIYAGADILLVPSRYEPCGLVQMIGLRYGTLPVVRKTGGLSDTVVDYNPFTGEGYGFVFEEYSESALWEAMKRAFQVYLQRGRWRKLVQRAMRLDFSWQHSVENYIVIYKKAIQKRKG